MQQLHLLLLLLLALVAVTTSLISEPHWYPCNTFTDIQSTLASQCAVFSLPLAPELPGEKVNIFIKRKVANKSTKALWILQGGPGAASDELDSLLKEFFDELDGEADVYLYEHRGTGRSSRLECVASQPETAGSEGGAQMTVNKYPECVKELKNKYGDKLGFYSTTEAARDVLNLIHILNSDKEVFVYGISYGTYLANRLKQLDEESGNPVISGIILDGVVATTGPRKLFVNEYDARFQEIGVNFLNLCLNDPKFASCGSQFKVYNADGKLTSESLLRQVYDNLFVKNACPVATKYLTEAGLKRKLGSMLMSSNVRQLMPALLFRLLRCDPDVDSAALEFFFESTKPEVKEPKCKSLDSDLLRLNVMYGELINATTFTYDYMERIFNESLIARGQMMITAAPVYQMFKEAGIIYTPSPEYYDKAFSSNKTSVLVMNGDMDPQTPSYFAEEQLNAIESPNKKLVVIPYAPHGTIASSPVPDSDLDCAVQMLVSFVKDPYNTDTSCVTKVLPPNFAGEKEVNLEYFGVNDIWEGAYTPTETVPTIELWTMLGVVTATLVIGVIAIPSLIYYAIKLHMEKRSLRQ